MHANHFILLMVFVSLCRLSVAQPTDRQLYDAYLRRDMQVWADYLDSIRWQDADDEEKSRILVYEYGYVPYLYSVKDTAGCRKANLRYQRHIEAHKGVLPKADYLGHSSAASIYFFLQDKTRMGVVMSGKKMAEQAVQADTLNPLALYIRGNFYFHFPKLFGGSKSKALAYFLRAEREMEKDSRYRYHWMYAAVQLVAAQCYDKLGEKDKAAAQCRKILRLHPGFKYVKEELLPSLQ